MTSAISCTCRTLRNTDIIDSNASVRAVGSSGEHDDRAKHNHEYEPDGVERGDSESARRQRPAADMQQWCAAVHHEHVEQAHDQQHDHEHAR